MMNYPQLPKYKFFWRSIQIEPIPNSGERFTLGTIVQGEDGALIAAKLIPNAKLNSLFGKKFSHRISEALDITITSAESFYADKKIYNDWDPPVDGFFISHSRESLAKNIEEGLINAARYSSSISVSLGTEKQTSKVKPEVFNPKTWRKEILNQIKTVKKDWGDYFNKEISLSGSGIPFEFGFISVKYAAHFSTISENRSLRQDSLVKAQSKLWQLDQLRNSNQLFHPEAYELILYQPKVKKDSFIYDFTEELRSEASRREIDLYTSSSAKEAANHVIENAA